MNPRGGRVGYAELKLSPEVLGSVKCSLFPASGSGALVNKGVTSLPYVVNSITTRVAIIFVHQVRLYLHRSFRPPVLMPMPQRRHSRGLPIK